MRASQSRRGEEFGCDRYGGVKDCCIVMSLATKPGPIAKWFDCLIVNPRIVQPSNHQTI